MVVSEEKEREQLIDGLKYLHRHALEAHRAGDGMQVLHHSTIALRKSIQFGEAHPEFKLQMHEVRWAFILGMYWMVHTTFLLIVKAGFEHIDCKGVNHTDSQTIILIYNLLSEPHIPLDLNEIDAITSEWWNERSTNFSEEDSVALTFAVELIWHSDPLGTNWSSLVSEWLNNIPKKSILKSRLEILQKRLTFQSGFYDGSVFHKLSKNNLPVTDPIQRKLFHGWVAYYNCEWEVLSSIINQLKYWQAPHFCTSCYESIWLSAVFLWKADVVRLEEEQCCENSLGVR